MDYQSNSDSQIMEKSLSDFPKHEVNPFMSQLLHMKNMRNKFVATGSVLNVFDGATGEVHNDKFARSWIIQRVDNEEFTKIFNNYLKVVFNLSSKALKLFQYFIIALKFNDERVIFDPKEAARITGYSSKQTILRALAELISAEIIARSAAPNIYFINPKAFVKGNRLDMIKTWVQKNSPEDKMLLAEINKHTKEKVQLALFDEEPERKVISNFDSEV